MGADRFLAGAINLRAGETKNDEGRTVPIVPQLRALLLEQRSRRQDGCEFVCFRLDRKGHAMKLRGFRKAGYGACIKTRLGRMEAVIDEQTGKPVFEKPRGLCPKPKPKPKMVYRGTVFHDLRRTGVRNLVRAGVPERIAMTIGGHRARSIFERYKIVSPNDVAEAGRKLAAFHGQKFGDNSGVVGTEM